MSQDPEKLSRLGLFQPKLFTSVLPEDKDHDLNLDKVSGDFVGRYTSPDELVERAMECELLYKPLALYKLLSENEGPQRTLVFANSGNMTHRLALLIGILGKDKGLTVAEISGQLSHKEREIVLSKFSRGDIQVLVKFLNSLFYFYILNSFFFETLGLSFLFQIDQFGCPSSWNGYPGCEIGCFLRPSETY